MSKLEKALASLRPGVAWELPGEQVLSNVIWPEGADVPSMAEVEAEISRLQAIEDAQRRYTQASAAVKGRLNALAQSWEYDSYQSAMGYVGSTVAKFNAEAVVIRDSAAAHWAVFDHIRAGDIPEPETVDELLALMPALPERPVAPYV
jgi:hypothetical protein